MHNALALLVSRKRKTGDDVSIELVTVFLLISVNVLAVLITSQLWW